MLLILVINDKKMEATIGFIDIGIIIAYFMLVFAIGLWVGRKAKTGDDLFLGGRSLTWGFIGLSLFASNISSTTLVGLAGAAYTTGIVQSVYEWGAAIPFAILAFIYVPLYLKAKITTIPEFLELRFDRRSRVFFSLVTIVASILIDTAGSLYAGALVIKIFFPAIELWQTCVVLALITGIYTAIGGLKAVVYTDALQAVILIFGASALSFLLFEQLDFSWANMVAAAPEGHFSVIKPLDDEGLPWLGLLLGVPMLGFWYVATNQYITQRVLGAKSIQHARWGIMLAGALKFLPLFIMVLPGAMAISIYPDIVNSDMVFPTIVIQTLPVGLVGLVLAGLVSAIMSSISSTLNSASTLVVVDFVKPNNPNMPEKQVVLNNSFGNAFLYGGGCCLGAANYQFWRALDLFAANVFDFCSSNYCVIWCGDFLQTRQWGWCFWDFDFWFLFGHFALCFDFARALGDSLYD